MMKSKELKTQIYSHAHSLIRYHLTHHLHTTHLSLTSSLTTLRSCTHYHQPHHHHPDPHHPHHHHPFLTVMIGQVLPTMSVQLGALWAFIQQQQYAITPLLPS